MAETAFRKAPPGFTHDQWETFMDEGMLVIEDALSDDEVESYLDVIDRVCADSPKYDPGRFFGPSNIVEKDPDLAALIDHERHVGFAYDVYGELLKLHLSQIFLRPHDSSHNAWHPDGARAVPYGVYAPALPMQVKISYWLTDLPEARMGNFVYKPGSHKSQGLDAYTTHESLPDEKILCCRRGTMTLTHCGTWHRVEPNESDVVRKNIFLAYCPSWVCEADRHQSSPDFLETLNREQRIIMRSYSYGYDRTKPPADDFPLFLDRGTGLEADLDSDGKVPLRVRKRRTEVEKFSLQLTADS